MLSRRLTNQLTALTSQSCWGCCGAESTVNARFAQNDFGKGLLGRGLKRREDFLMPPMTTGEIAIVCALFGVLVLWFGIYLWRQIRDP